MKPFERSQSLLNQVNVSNKYAIGPFWTYEESRNPFLIRSMFPTQDLRDIRIFHILSRNPFLIRSMFPTRLMKQLQRPPQMSRNPFLIRSMFPTGRVCAMVKGHPTGGRNPFLIRSMFPTEIAQVYHITINLSRNPFLIRSMFPTHC